MTTHRPERIADVIREVLARALREEVRDPRIGFVTLTGVHLSPDLRHARVFFSMLESEPVRERTRRALERAVPFFRRKLATESGLRYVPSLEFRHDATLESGDRVERLLAQLREPREPSDPGEDE